MFLFRSALYLILSCAMLSGLSTLHAQQRVILASFDGLGQQIFEKDLAGGELRNLKAVARLGSRSRGVQSAFPSTTANSHAAIWTGAYGDRNGVSGNANPVVPRAGHTFLERRVGFRSESLQAEPLWVSAARQSLSVVAHQATQAYPFTSLSAGLDLVSPPVVLNSYQTRKVADYRVLRAADVEALPEIAWDPPLAASALPPMHFTWKSGPVRFIASLISQSGGRYDKMLIAERADGPRVVAPLSPTETRWARDRALAIHFSEALMIEDPATVAEYGPLAAVFRLWETSAGGDFLLLSTPLQELGFAHGRNGSADAAKALLGDAGPLAGNGPSLAYLTGRLGAPLYLGGDGQAELRFLECMEFITRQYNSYTEWLWERYQPRLLIDYFPFPDEMDHGWLGLSLEAGDPAFSTRAARFMEFRRRGYQIVDERVGLLRRLASSGNAVLAITSDHGMAAVTKNVNIDAALREAGYLELDENEQIDAKRSRATGDYAILLNTEDWKGGIVPLAQKPKVLADLASRLGAIVDPDTGKPVFAAFYTAAEHGEKFGIGGASGFDLYFDLAPGYAPERRAIGPVVEALEVPRGRHGFLPIREDMRAIFIAHGKGIRPGLFGRIRSTQIAPMVSRWLGIDPPAAALGNRP
ncbi:MAG: alkaline phosphatase family protein [Bryobacterales bacterium]|nr:alkaline phosphatase family protein [Bryobacterales bacterium]